MAFDYKTKRHENGLFSLQSMTIQILLELVSFFNSLNYRDLLESKDLPNYVSKLNKVSFALFVM